MQIKLSISGIGFCIQCQDELKIRGLLKKYISDIDTEVQISIISKSQVAELKFPYRGEDMFCRYYGDLDNLQVESKGSHGIPSAMLFCEDGLRNIRFELYEQMQSGSKMLDGLFSLLPVRQILYRFDAFIFHSSRIEIDRKAVLFTGPSGIGKTTQALLWKEYEGALHLSNDRSIIRLQHGVWNTYGYFEDGSNPIAENKCLALGAIVVLKQDTENKVSRMNGKAALKALMEQVFLDRWDYIMFDRAIDGIMNLLRTIPVYYLQCVPNRTAVECLKRELSREGVINWEQK